MAKLVIDGRRATIRTRNGERHFRLIGSHPYTNKDGVELDLLDWQGNCVDCGAPFVVSTTQTPERCERAFGRARCDLHKRAVA